MNRTLSARATANWWIAIGVLLIAMLLIMIVVLASTVANAEMSGASPAITSWVESLRVPGSGISCCSTADCSQTEFRTADDHYEVWVDDRWLAVPPTKVLDRLDNPTGRAVVCWTPSRGIMCFVRGAEA